MKIVIASDSHGKSEDLKKIELIENADYYFHCGDSCDDAYSISPFVSCKGNCDLYHYDRELILKINNFKYLITHGHFSSILGLKYRGVEENINVILTGHTHIPHMEIIDNILFINPGSTSRPRGGSKKSYCVLEMSEQETDINNIKVTFKEIVW